MQLGFRKTSVLGVLDELATGLVRAVLLQIDDCAMGSGKRKGREDVLSKPLRGPANGQKVPSSMRRCSYPVTARCQ
jgi:hypothetical protein